MLSDSLIFGADPDYAVSVYPPTAMGRGTIGELAGGDREAQMSEQVLERTSARAVPEFVEGARVGRLAVKSGPGGVVRQRGPAGGEGEREGTRGGGMR
jgi:hypothetical protein